MSSIKSELLASTGRRGKAKKKSPLPMRDGVSASRVWLPKVGASNNATEQQGPWLTIFDFLMAYFPFIPHAVLLERLSRGDIVTETGEVVTPKTPYQAEIHVFYYRDVPDEPRIPFEEKILFKDDNIGVVCSRGRVLCA